MLIDDEHDLFFIFRFAGARIMFNTVPFNNYLVQPPGMDEVFRGLSCLHDGSIQHWSFSTMTHRRLTGLCICFNNGRHHLFILFKTVQMPGSFEKHVGCHTRGPGR
jgi:hypothetical protein